METDVAKKNLLILFPTQRYRKRKKFYRLTIKKNLKKGPSESNKRSSQIKHIL